MEESIFIGVKAKERDASPPRRIKTLRLMSGSHSASGIFFDLRFSFRQQKGLTPAAQEDHLSRL